MTNRIAVNYGVLNTILGITEPLQLFPGKASVGRSVFNASQTSIIVDYKNYTHEFSGFVDEIRQAYPGVYIGKMYGEPGASLYGGLIKVKANGPPVFAVNFILFQKASQATVASG